MKKAFDNSVDKKEAIALLLLKNNEQGSIQDSTSASDYLDEYGNYVFSTDAVVKEPNIAYGSLEGYCYISRFNSKNR